MNGFLDLDALGIYWKPFHQLNDDCFFGLAIECPGKYHESLFDLSVLFEYYLLVYHKG
mgnify:CR=1 FL=1